MEQVDEVVREKGNSSFEITRNNFGIILGNAKPGCSLETLPKEYFWRIFFVTAFGSDHCLRHEFRRRFFENKNSLELLRFDVKR